MINYIIGLYTILLIAFNSICLEESIDLLCDMPQEKFWIIVHILGYIPLIGILTCCFIF